MSHSKCCFNKPSLIQFLKFRVTGIKGEDYYICPQCKAKLQESKITNNIYLLIHLFFFIISNFFIEKKDAVEYISSIKGAVTVVIGLHIYLVLVEIIHWTFVKFDKVE